MWRYWWERNSEVVSGNCDGYTEIGMRSSFDSSCSVYLASNLEMTNMRCFLHVEVFCLEVLQRTELAGNFAL